MRRIVPVILIALFSSHAMQASNTVINNQEQFDDWEHEAQDVLGNAARKAGIKPGERFTFGLEVCIDNEVANVIFAVTGGEGNTVYVDKISVNPGGDECNPSTDLNGGNLSSPNSIQSIQNDVSGLLSGKWRAPVSLTRASVSPKATPSTSFALVPPYRDVPFIPVYQPPTDFPQSLDCDPQNGATTIQVHHASNTVSVNNGCSGQVIATIPVGSAPLQVGVTPDASTAVVTCFNNEIDFIDLTTNKVAGSILTAQQINPSGIAISPDGSTAYVTSFSSAEFGGTAALLVINIAQRSIVKQLPVSDLPQSVFVTPDGSQVWVTHPFPQVSTQIEIFDALSNSLSYRLAMQGSYAIAFNSTGTRAFITSGTSNVAVIDTATFANLANVTVGQGPVDIALTPEDGLLIVENYQDQSISLVDSTAYTLLGTFPLPGAPRGLALVQ